MAERTAELLKVGTANQSMLVEEGEKILKELQERDFTQVNQSVTVESRLALDALGNARQMLNNTLELHKQALDANKTLEMLRMKFQQTFDTTMIILDRVIGAELLNKQSKMLDPEVSCLFLYLYNFISMLLKFEKVNFFIQLQSHYH